MIANRPEAWAVYQEQLRSRLAEYGIPRMRWRALKNPVLVRERVTELTPENAGALWRLPMRRAWLAFPSAEQAVVDAGRISNDALA